MLQSEFYQHNLSNGKSIRFYSFPLDKPFIDPHTKQIDQNLQSILLDAHQYREFHVGNNPSIDKIFLGFSTPQPNNYPRFPIWLPPSLIDTHILIGGSIGSGKTSVTYRLIAGALNTYGTVVIGEAKGGLKGYREGDAAFTDLSEYLDRAENLGSALSVKVKTYRWPRGNCWFNPFLYLESKDKRKDFMLTIAEQIEVGEGELKAYIIDVAPTIAAWVLEFLVTASWDEERKMNFLTIRQLVKFLKDPGSLEAAINTGLENWKANKQITKELTSIKGELERRNFFALKSPEGRDRFIMTASGLNLFINRLDNEDLFHYTEKRSKGRDGQTLIKLELDDILYQRALVVISQPLEDKHAKVTGPFFWDTLLNFILALGPNQPIKNGKSREKVAVFLDETHRLPVGELGNSGDFLRQYHIGLIEITPTVVDQKRWEQNKHIYQTIISLSPGVDEVVKLIYDRLPNQQQDLWQIGLEITPEGKPRVFPKMNDQTKVGQDNPGVSLRSLRETGRYTALLHCQKIPNAQGCFWIDLETELLENFSVLLKDALNGKRSAIKLVDYTLGLVKEYTNK